MKTRNLFYLLGLAMMAILIVVPPTVANATNLLDMADRLDKLDQQDFQSVLNKADDCTQVRNFTCSEEQLRKATKLANGSKDKQALNRAKQNLQAEKKRFDDEIRARAEEERQIRLAEERRADQERAQEQAAENRRQEEERQAANSSSDGGSYNPGLAIMQGIGEAFNKQNQLGKIQNDTMQAAQERQAQADADRRAAAERRAQENERIRQQNQARREQEQQERLQKQARLREQEQTKRQEQARIQEQARKKAEDAAAKRQAKTAQGDVLALNTASKNGDKSASGPNSGASGDDGNNTKTKGKSTAKKTFRKVPNTPPQGSASGGLTKANGEYKCDAINAYARQYGKDGDRLFKERMDAPYVSDAKCQTRCDLLSWREILINTYRYHGDWSCSDSAVGLWHGVDDGGSYSNYNNGKNDDKCTCVTSSGSPIVFSPKPK